MPLNPFAIRRFDPPSAFACARTCCFPFSRACVRCKGIGGLFQTLGKQLLNRQMALTVALQRHRLAVKRQRTQFNHSDVQRMLQRALDRLQFLWSPTGDSLGTEKRLPAWPHDEGRINSASTPACAHTSPHRHPPAVGPRCHGAAGRRQSGRR